LPAPGQAAFGDWIERDGQSLDEAILTGMPSSASWSRLECWTVSVHGGTWIQQRLRESLGEDGGEYLEVDGVLRLALRLGALDAVQACAYRCLLDAATPRSAAFLTRQYQGALSRELRRLEAVLEACSGASGDAVRGVQEVRAAVDALLEQATLGLRLATPLRLLIAGAPNAGKSTLFNALVEDERVAVAPVSGTTRDVIEEFIALEDCPVVLADSAGLRAGEDVVERLGVERTLERMEPADSDAILYLVRPPWRLTRAEEGLLERLSPARLLLVATQLDRWDPEGASAVEGASATVPAAPVRSSADAEALLAGARAQLDGSKATQGMPVVAISARTGEGMDVLRQSIVERWIGAVPRTIPEPDAAPFTSAQVVSLERAANLLGASEPDLDVVRRIFLECLDFWPPT